jgi:hypothetical protein
MAHSGLIACAAAGLASLGSAAAAQQTENRSEIGLSTRLTYDTNIARSSEAVARARGLVREDVRFSPALELDIARTVGRHVLYVDAVAGRDIHARNSRLDRERLQGRAGVSSRFGWCRSTLEATAARRQSELQDIILGDIENTESTASVLARISCPKPAGFYPSASVEHASVENGSAIRRNADSQTLRGEAALNYAQPSLGEIALFLRYSETDFPNRLISLAPGGEAIRDRFESRQAGLIYSRNVGTLLRGSVGVSYTQVDRALAGQTFDGVTYSASLRVRPEQRLSATLSAERSVQPSNRIGISYSVDKAAAAALNYRLNPRVQFGAGGSIRDRRFELAPGTLVVTLTDEETRTLFASMRIDLSQRLRFGVDARREERDSNVRAFDYVSNRIEVTASISF